MYMANFKQLDRPNLSRSVQKAIRNYILDHKLYPGDALPSQGEIAKALGVSRTSVREAVRALESLGILEVRHGAGLFVRDGHLDAVLDTLSYSIVLEPSRLLDLLHTRKLLETSMIPQVVQRIELKDLKICREILDQWESKADSASSYTEQDGLFHQALYRVMDNQFIVELIGVFFAAQRSAELRMDIAPHPERSEIERHREILRAIEAKNEDLAKQLMLEHFQRGEGRLESILKRRERP
jgi:DNA-binding FadR family transcriptional regulator